LNYLKSNLLRFQNCGDQDMFRSFFVALFYSKFLYNFDSPILDRLNIS
jgi:hypothetical protein